MALVLALLTFAALCALLLLASYFVTVVPNARPALSQIQDLFAVATALATLLAMGAMLLYRRRPQSYPFRARWISISATLILVVAIVVVLKTIAFGLS